MSSGALAHLGEQVRVQGAPDTEDVGQRCCRRGLGSWQGVTSVAGRVLTQLGPWLPTRAAQGAFPDWGPSRQVLRAAEGEPGGLRATELQQGHWGSDGACRAFWVLLSPEPSQVGAPTHALRTCGPALTQPSTGEPRLLCRADRASAVGPAASHVQDPGPANGVAAGGWTCTRFWRRKSESTKRGGISPGAAPSPCGLGPRRPAL